MNKRTLFHLSVFTLFGFSLIAYLIMHFNVDKDFWDLFTVHRLPLSILYGTGFGLLASGLALLFLKIGPFDAVNDFFGEMIQKINPSWYHILFYSFCAGVGEEILFRGAIQSYLHVWPTAIIFVLIHGYINPSNWRLSLYGIFLVFISGGFGYLVNIVDLYAAMTAHFVYDVVMFSFLKFFPQKKD